MKNYKVTREQLKEVYDIACDAWKKKIEKLTQETLGSFGDEGELSEETVQSMRDASSHEQRKTIDLIFPMPKGVMDRVVNYASACKELGYTPLKLSAFNHLPEVDRYRTFIHHQLVVQVRALNGIDYEHDFKDNKSKYYVYGYLNSDKKEYVLDVDFIYSSFSCVGSALLLKNNELANHAKRCFEKQYLTHHFNIK